MSVIAPLKSLAELSPFAWLRERDIDLLLCSEIHAGGACMRLLARNMDIDDAQLAGAWVSYPDVDGESDLVVAFSSGDKKVVGLIENKIRHNFEPEQAERYQARARRWLESDEVERVVTVLLAPGAYMQNSGAELFEKQISYETVEESLRSEQDARSAFLADALAAGIKSYQEGYVMVPDDTVSGMWHALWSVSRTVAPDLRFQQPGQKPGGSMWLYFKDASGFTAEDLKRVIVVLKAERGHADLQVANTSTSLLHERAEGILDDDMVVVKAGKSASIRLTIPAIDFVRPVQEQREAMEAGFKACDRLRRFFLENRRQLLGLESQSG